MRIACVLITHLRAKAEMRRHNEERENTFDSSSSESLATNSGSQEPCAQAVQMQHAVADAQEMRSQQPSTLIVDRGGATGGPPLVVDYFPGAPGVKTGMTLEQAVSYVADTVVLNADEPYYRQIFGEVIRSLQGISDRVEGGELGTAYVRLDGLESLFGGEERVVRALLDAVPADLKPRIGVADAKFPAFVAARMRAPGVSHAPAEVRGFLAPYSVELLPVAADVKSKLRRFGLHTMGEVAAMEEHLIVAQFGT